MHHSVNSNINLLRWYNFFYDFRPYVAVAILYYAHIADSYTLGFAVFSVAAIASTVFEIPTGIISDKIGRRKTIIYGSLFSIIAVSIYAFAGSFIILCAAAIFNGLTRALMSGNNDALLYDSLSELNRTDDYADKHGKVNAMFEIGLGLSALIGGAVAALYSLQATMIVSIVPQVICFFIALRFIEPNVHDDKAAETNVLSHLSKSFKAFLINVRLRKLSLANIINSGIDETVYNFKPAFNALIWPTWALGITRALDSVFGFLGFHFAGKVVDKFGGIKTLLGQKVIETGNSMVFVAFPNILSPIALSINAFFFGVGKTSNSTLMQVEFTDKQRATMGSLDAFGGSLFFAAFAFLVGVLADKSGVTKALLATSLCYIVVILLYWSLRKHELKNAK